LICRNEELGFYRDELKANVDNLLSELFGVEAEKQAPQRVEIGQRSGGGKTSRMKRKRIGLDDVLYYRIDF
jgi:hypothetical protein